jgi:phage shock protein PspC (stress-responsive transcriptional regulator)
MDTPKRTGAGLAILCGTLVVGTLDALDAIIFFGVRGATPVRIFQSIASGLIGRDAFQGDNRTAWLGVVLHYLIAFLIVLVFFLISRRVRFLIEHPIVSGLAYGIAVYFTMNHLVIPLSAAVQGPFSLPVFANGILIHIFGVGLPAALFARMAR